MIKKISVVFFALYSSLTYAISWVPPFDPWLRADLEYQVSQHLLNRPISTWPLPLETMHRSKQHLSQSSLTTLRSLSSNTFSVIVSAHQKSPTFGDFGFSIREKSNSNFAFHHSTKHLEVHLTGQVVDLIDADSNEKPNGESNTQLKHDNTYVNASLGQWTLGIGAIDRWWGPGWDSGLILTTNARPVPSIYLSRNRTSAPESPWLSWLGTWTMTTFMGQLEENRAIPNALLWGLRASFKPSNSWEIGLSRTAVWAGDGRPKDFQVFSDILVGNDNIQPSHISKNDEPSNQLAGFDFKYSNSYRSTGFSIYGELIGEDEVGALPTKPLLMFGVSIHMPIKNRMHTAFIEYSDTALNGHRSEQIFGLAYRHGLYKTGYLHKGRPLGSTYDNDSKVLAIGSLFALNQDYKFRSTLRFLNLNRGDASVPDDPANNSISSQQLRTQQISLILAKRWSSVTTDIFLLWNSKDPAVKSDNIDSLAGFSISLRL